MTNAFLARLRQLTTLDDHDLQQIEALWGVRTFPARADILKEGAAANQVHVVLEGWACRYRTLADGRRQVSALVLPGDVCDLDGLQLSRFDEGVASLTACTVATIPHDRLKSLLNKIPALREVFWWLTAAENAVMSEWALCLGRRSAQERLAHLICELQVRLAAVGLADGGGYALPLTQQDLSDALGLSVVHVNRMFQTLRAEGLVRLEARRLVLTDGEKLARLAEFKPGYLHLDGMRPRPTAL